MDNKALCGIGAIVGVLLTKERTAVGKFIVDGVQSCEVYPTWLERLIRRSAQPAYT